MLGNSEMDRKLARSGQSPKGTVDFKKVQDVQQAKLFTKNNRRRESSAELSKKALPVQKCKFDKRPSPRRFANSRRTISQLEDDCEDVGIGTSQSKKKNVNYLLNFRCKPRERSYVPVLRSEITTQRHKYSKEQFLQASCQFVVRDTEDYSKHFGNPDVLVDWELIEQVRVYSPETITCPICLHSPVAAKITRCGHIYCWTCLICYFSFNDFAEQKCPICYELIHQNDLKSVQVIERKSYSVGEEIIFRLMKREKDSTIVVPVSETNSRDANKFFRLKEYQNTSVYSKLLMADYQNVLNIVEEEEAQLKVQLKEMEHTTEYCFAEMAIEYLNERKRNLIQKIQNSSGPSQLTIVNDEHSVEEVSDTDPNLVENNVKHREVPLNRKICYISAFEELQISDENGSCLSNIESVGETNSKAFKDSDVILTKEERRNSKECDEDFLLNSLFSNTEELEEDNSQMDNYFYYQAEDGQQVFLCSMNARMLDMTYGGLHLAPEQIRGIILEKEIGSMTYKLRKRYRYLEHLPLSSVFEFVEIDLQPPVISHEAVIHFTDETERRRYRRYRRAREEKKIERRVQAQEEIDYGPRRSPPRRLRLDSLRDFPECGVEFLDSSSESSCSDSSDRSMFPTLITPNVTIETGSTFAEKLKDSKLNAWRNKRVSSESGEYQSTSSGCNLSDAVEAALLQANLDKGEGESRQGKKKRKPKPIPLCSIGMANPHR